MLYKFSVEGEDIGQVRVNARAVAKQAFTNGSFGMASHIVALLEILVIVDDNRMVGMYAQCVAGGRDEVTAFAYRNDYDPEVLS